MTEIEKCVCGGEARFDGEWVSCYECGREGEVFTFGEPDARAKAIASWNHDMRGLRLLRELAAIRDRALSSGMIYTGKESSELVDTMQKADAWAKEGDRE